MDSSACRKASPFQNLKFLTAHKGKGISVAYSNRHATPPKDITGHARMTDRETNIMLMIKRLQTQQYDAQYIAERISREFNNCTLEGVVKQYITGVSQCTVWDHETQVRGY